MVTPVATPVVSEVIFSKPQVITRGEIQDIAASPDGRWLAVASASGLYLHDAQSLAFERALLEERIVYGVAFSPDGELIAAFGSDWIWLFDLRNGQTIRWVQTSVRKLDFLPDGNSLVGLESWDVTASLHIWDLSNWDERAILVEVEDTSRSMALSPDGKSVALGSEWGWVEVFDLESAARQAVLSERTELPVTDLAYSPDGSLLAAADLSADGRVRVWSVVERKKVVEQYASGYHSIQPFVAFSADGKRLLGGMGDVAIAWERDSGEQTGVLYGYASGLMDLDISPDGERLAYATYNWPVYVHDLEGRTQPRVLSVPDYQAFNVAFTSGAKIVTAGLYSYAPEPRQSEPAEMVQMWDVAAGDETQTLPGASAFAFAPDGRSISLADSQGTLRVIDLASQKDICLPGCACDPDNSLAAGGSCTLKLPHELSPMKLAYSADSSLLSAWGVAGTWSASGLIELETGEKVAWFEGGSRISFGRYGLIALGVDELNADHGIAAHWLVLYDLVNRKELRRVELPATGAAALSPDGRWLAVGLSSFEKTNPTGLGLPDPEQNGLMIWDVEVWRQVAYYPLPYGVTRLAFSPDGAFLITASETGEILRWNQSH